MLERIARCVFPLMVASSYIEKKRRSGFHNLYLGGLWTGIGQVGIALLIRDSEPVQSLGTG